MMILVNELTLAEVRPLGAIRILLILLNPFAPHITEELWQRLTVRFPEFVGPVSNQNWPEWDERFLVEEETEIVVQVNGKLRDKMRVPNDATNEDLERAALALEKVQTAISGRSVRKVVIVPKRLVNIVAE
jgi:leucyl-tRNA synthetase